MFSFFRRKPPSQPTFSERVDAFWRWYRQAAPRFYSAIEAGQSPRLADEVSAKIDALLPGFCWVFGPGAGGKGHSFTLTGEGNIHRQLLALEWLARAPAIEGWTFHAARQPGPIRDRVIEMGDLRFDPKEIWVTPFVNTEQESIDLIVSHPSWERIEPKIRNTVTFLFLDEALGEYGTEWWIGKIDFGHHSLAGSFPLEELSEQVTGIAREHGWEKHPPGGGWTLFRSESGDGKFPRADVLTQNTCVPRLFDAYMKSAGNLDDPLAGTGADYVYVSMDTTALPDGKEVERRCEIEESIETALGFGRGGRLIGGALGTERSYCDFLIYDGARSLEAIKQALRAQHVPKGTMIEYFAREKRGQRIVV